MRSAGKYRRLPSYVIPITGLLLAAVTTCSTTTAQTQYVFRPGSRQAVEVNSAANAPYNYPGNAPRTGGMTRQSSGDRYIHYSGPTRNHLTASQGSAGPKQFTNQVSAAQAGRANPGQSHTGARHLQSAGSRDYVDVVEVQSLRRTFEVHLPPAQSKSRSLPVVLVFPGLHMHANEMSAVTGMSGVANRNDFIVVYCESVGGEWQDGMKNRNVDDIAYVQTVLNRLDQSVGIDRHRVYAVGLSNGGYFAQLLACSMPDKIAAIGVVASTGMEQALKRSSGEKAIPVMFFIGTEDPLINWGDGKSRTIPKLGVQIDPGFFELARYGGWWTVSDLITWWTNHNGCPGAPATSYEADRDPSDGMRVKKESWGHRGNAVVLYTIEGGGHTWPGCIFLAKMYDKKCCQDIDTSETLWQFFRGESR